MVDLAIIIVSTNEGQWLRPCLTTIFASVGDGITVDVVVADNESTDETRDVVAEFPDARTVPSRNLGFSHANNRGFVTTDARYVLFLNPDTEIREGTFADLVRYMDDHPGVGLIGVKQILGDGELFPTIRYFPNALRSAGEALGSERLPGRRRWLGERELDMTRYDSVVPCDWTTGSFMFTRREAIDSAGVLDERFFIYSEETDFCLRIKQSGWQIVHVPLMTIVHYAEKAGVSARVEAQEAYARLQYARKHFSPAHQALHFAALVLRHAIRLALFRTRSTAWAAERQAAERRALRTMFRREPPPFGAPPATAMQPRDVAALSAAGRDHSGS